ncbi:putative catechol O-methyltransferase [Phytophthora cinnamomi]|uniref:putative catechol O-methyltransferase n=1 Tax=Phytophthora cinnamomi TaxID=4785 RepID=UPI003559CABE|nr:putative catechol O-methyltransferase [Phytophthora cinnamomi]
MVTTVSANSEQSRAGMMLIVAETGAPSCASIHSGMVYMHSGGVSLQRGHKLWATRLHFIAASTLRLLSSVSPFANSPHPSRTFPPCAFNRVPMKFLKTLFRKTPRDSADQASNGAVTGTLPPIDLARTTRPVKSAGSGEKKPRAAKLTLYMLLSDM